MDDTAPPTTLHSTLWHIPSGTLLRTSDVRGEAMQLAATLLGEGTLPGHLRLQCACMSDRPLTPHAGVRFAMVAPKWG
jgi:hypothetical protein